MLWPTLCLVPCGIFPEGVFQGHMEMRCFVTTLASTRIYIKLVNPHLMSFTELKLVIQVLSLAFITSLLFLSLVRKNKKTWSMWTLDNMPRTFERQLSNFPRTTPWKPIDYKVGSSECMTVYYKELSPRFSWRTCTSHKPQERPRSLLFAVIPDGSHRSENRV